MNLNVHKSCKEERGPSLQIEPVMMRATLRAHEIAGSRWEWLCLWKMVGGYFMLVADYGANVGCVMSSFILSRAFLSLF